MVFLHQRGRVVDEEMTCYRFVLGLIEFNLPGIRRKERKKKRNEKEKKRQRKADQISCKFASTGFSPTHEILEWKIFSEIGIPFVIDHRMSFLSAPPEKSVSVREET